MTTSAAVPPRPSTASPSSARGLPAPLAPLVGREREAAVVRALLEHQDVRLLTLTGPGGVGKTRLALRVATDLAEDFADGVAFVPLAPTADPALVASAIAQALGLRETGGRQPIDALIAFLGRKTFLLVLDNFEHILDAAPAVTDLLAACPNLKVLVTSREILHLYGEQAYLVPPLALPDLDRLPPLAELGRIEAVRLFSDRAAAAGADFVLTDGNAAAVAAICAHLDGLPLAIELAAARSAMFPPAALLARLDRRLPLLTGGPRDLPARLRTMRDAIAWSHDLLPPAEQALFRRLAVFVGGFSLDAAEAVGRGLPVEGRGAADESLDPRPSILDSVSSLLGKHLLRPVDGTGDEPRFGMLETIREYELERLEASGEAEAVQRRHASWCLVLAERLDAGLNGPDQGQRLRDLEQDIDNFRAALRWASERDPRLGLRLAKALGWSCHLRGTLSEGRAWLERSLAAADESELDVRAEVLRLLGIILTDLGEADLATERSAECHALWLRHGDPVGIAGARNRLGQMAYERGEYTEARACFEDTMAIFRAHDDRQGIALSLIWLGWTEFAAGNLVGARARFEECLVRYQALDYTQRVGRLHLSLGQVDEQEGALATAAARAEQALVLFQKVGYVIGIAHAECILGRIAFRRGDIAIAYPLVAAALRRLHGAGSWPDVAIALNVCADLAASRDRPDLALRWCVAVTTMRSQSSMAPNPLEDDQGEEPQAKARRTLGRTEAQRIEAAAKFADRDTVVTEALHFLDAPPDPIVDQAGGQIPKATDHPLSPRERDVLRLLVAGKTDREIAAALFISRKTASDHVGHILNKLGVANRAEAAAVAVRDGLV